MYLVSYEIDRLLAQHSNKRVRIAIDFTDVEAEVNSLRCEKVNGVGGSTGS